MYTLLHKLTTFEGNLRLLLEWRHLIYDFTLWDSLFDDRLVFWPKPVFNYNTYMSSLAINKSVYKDLIKLYDFQRSL